MGLFSNLPFRRSRPATPPVAGEATTGADAPAASGEEVRAQAEAVVRRVVQELPSFMAVAIVDGVSGAILAGQWAGPRGGAQEVAAAHAEMVQQARLAIEALQLEPAEELEDILITLHHQLHLLRVLPAYNWLLYLAVRTQDTNLALARTVLRTLATEVE